MPELSQLREKQEARARGELPPRPRPVPAAAAIMPVPRLPAAPTDAVVEAIETFHSMADPKRIPLAPPKTLRWSASYFTKDGDPITQHEAHRIQVEIGYEPPPWYNPAPQSDRLQVDDLLKYEDGFQPEIGVEPEPLHGRCAYCHRPRLGPDAPYCGYHSPHGAAWQAAAAERTAPYADTGAG